MKPRLVVTPDLVPTLAARVQAIADDHLSGASTLLRQAVAVLVDAAPFGAGTVDTVARALCAAQPAMAPLWNAAALAVGVDGVDAVRRLAAQVQRAPRALARVFAELLAGTRSPRSGDRPIAIATISASESVRLCLEALDRSTDLHVVCTEARPLFEGRRMAADLTAAGVEVTLCTDAAVSAVVEASAIQLDAIVVGADAVTPRWFVNKCGSRQLIAAVGTDGVPTYVVASRDKFIGPMLASELTPSGGPPEEVWRTPPPAVIVANPYFEKVPIEAVAMFVTDAGPVGPGSVLDLCRAAVPPASAARLVSLIRDRRRAGGA